jgi:hypothetical protein
MTDLNPIDPLLADMASAVDQGHDIRALQFRLMIAGHGLKSDPNLSHERQCWFWLGQRSAVGMIIRQGMVS